MSLLSQGLALFSGRRATHTTHLQDMLRSLLVMAWMVEARDPYTGGHLWRVSQFAHLLADAAGLPPEDIARITLGGFLHDLGKVGIPDQILKKRGALDDDEYALVKTHPDLGWRLLAGHPLAALVHAAVRAHHETPDGHGYPRGLVSKNIPLDARIIGICDAFDAMTSSRPYRRGMPTAQALDIIASRLGTQFDQLHGDHFIALGRQGLLDPIVGHSDQGIPLQECLTCGPLLVLRREQQVGDRIYCRNCGAEYLATPEGDRLQCKPSGRRGNPEALEAEADMALINRFIADSASALLLDKVCSIRHVSFTRHPAH
ncbi:MAG: HD-GYP domain-containing protein [Hylemonella sp.]|nr:HD-GYP domain-containing protein [Hylemonella sp.]